MQSVFLLAVPAILALFAGTAEATACNMTSPCPSSAPCCSEFGFCGTDNFCLGGCNPYASHTFASCTPDPICKDITHTFADQSRILSNYTLFDGNASRYDWVIDKGSIVNQNGDLGLILTQTNGGTRLSTTRYVHYGTITTRLKTGRWGGVVTAFITMSDIKDEIDWEFPGDATTEAQSNYFWQGVIPTGKSNGQTHTGLTDTYSNYHDYTIDWQPDTLTFSIDGKAVRTMTKASVMGADGVSRYPNTPSRVQLSLWPAGINGTASGTIDWAGGMINWNDPDYKSAGQFYALVKSVTIKCTNAQAIPANSNITSYVYGGSNSSTNTPTVVYSNRTTLLNGAASFKAVQGGMAGVVLATGLGLFLGVNALLL